MRTFAASFLLLLIGMGSATAQPAGPYVSGHVGASGGDGGGALIAGAAVGYMSPHRLAFELEIGVSPDVDFRPPPFAILTIFPAPTFESTGRLLWLQTNAIVTVVDAGKLRAAVVAGGGIVNVRRETSYSYAFAAPFFTFTGAPLPTIPISYLPPPSSTYTTIESALSLNAGGIVDYALTRRLRVGVDARYMHGFFSDPWKTARVAGRVQWQF